MLVDEESILKIFFFFNNNDLWGQVRDKGTRGVIAPGSENRSATPPSQLCWALD